MLRLRVLTAIVLLGIAIPVTLYLPPIAFKIMTLIFVMVGFWEWLRLLDLSAHVSKAWLAVAAIVNILLLPDLTAELANYLRLLWLGAAFFWLIVVIFFLPRGILALSQPLRHGMALLGLLILMAAWTALQTLYKIDLFLLFSVLLVVWVADIGAYFAGKRFGRHKLAVTISPGKTWEGALGGVILVFVVSILLANNNDSPTLAKILIERFGWPGFAIALLGLVAISIAGDLFESQLKRMAGRKDSSHLLPGHGGVLDRIDALLPVLPLAALILT